MNTFTELLNSWDNRPLETTVSALHSTRHHQNLRHHLSRRIYAFINDDVSNSEYGVK